MLWSFCCSTSEPTATLSFRPQEGPQVVTIALDNAICNPQSDLLVLIPHSLSPPTLSQQLAGLLMLRVVADMDCESTGKGYFYSRGAYPISSVCNCGCCEKVVEEALDNQPIGKGCYYLCYMRSEEGRLRSLGRSKPFLCGVEYEKAIWVRSNTPFKLPSPPTSSFIRSKCWADNSRVPSDLSRSTCEESSGSFLQMQSLIMRGTITPNRKEDLSPEEDVEESHGVPAIHLLEPKISGKKRRSSHGIRNRLYTSQPEDREEQRQMLSLLQQYNPATRSFFKCSIFSPSKRLFTVDEGTTPAEDPTPRSPHSVRPQCPTHRSENLTSSHCSDCAGEAEEKREDQEEIVTVIEYSSYEHSDRHSGGLSASFPAPPSRNTLSI